MYERASGQVQNSIAADAYLKNRVVSHEEITNRVVDVTKAVPGPSLKALCEHWQRFVIDLGDDFDVYFRQTKQGRETMYAVLSPAKKLVTPVRQHPGITTPAFMEQTERLVNVMRSQSPSDLQNLMGISENLAQLNVERYQAFSTPLTVENATPAALTFAGDTYQGLNADSLSDDDLAFAQENIGILSGLFGLLRPLDLIQPYRLEMGTRLKTHRGSTLYEYWGESIAKAINAQIESHDDQTLINLASQEYFSAVKTKVLVGPVLTPVFKDVRKGQAKVISFLAKRARGMMARYIVENRVQSANDIKAFTEGGYRFDEALSTDSEWVFIRPELS